MKLLIVGDRNWTDKQRIWREVAIMPSKPAMIITGGNLNKGKQTYRGADGCAREVAIDMHIPYQIFYADWDRHGNRAGPIRNQMMLEDGRPDFGLAFHADLEHSRGTKDMVERLNKAGVPYRVITQ